MWTGNTKIEPEIPRMVQRSESATVKYREATLFIIRIKVLEMITHENSSAVLSLKTSSVTSSSYEIRVT